MLCSDAVRVTQQDRSASPTMINGWTAMIVQQVDIGAMRYVICVPLRILRCAKGVLMKNF